MKACRFLLALALLACSLTALAQQPAGDAAKRREVAARVMQQIGFEKLFDTMVEQMMHGMGPLLEQSLKANGAPEAQRREFLSKFPPNFMAEIRKPEVRRQFTDAVIALLVNDYSLEELEALSSFYATPLAQKMLARQPSQMQAMSAQGSKIGEQAGRKAAELTLRQIGAR